MDEAAKTALSVREPTAAQTSVAAVAARNGAPATHPPRSAGKSENTQVSSTQTSAVAARAARVFGSFGAPPPSGGALGVHPLNAGVSAPAAAVPVQSARSRRDEIAAALTAQAEKRTGRTLQTNDEFMSEESSSGPMPEPPLQVGLTIGAKRKKPKQNRRFLRTCRRAGWDEKRDKNELCRLLVKSLIFHKGLS